jgi:hypothetical protein
MLGLVVISNIVGSSLVLLEAPYREIRGFPLSKSFVSRPFDFCAKNTALAAPLEAVLHHQNPAFC